MTHSTAELVESQERIRELVEYLDAIGQTCFVIGGRRIYTDDLRADRLQQQERLREALQRIADMTDIEADFDGFEAREIASRALTQSGNGGTAKHDPETCHVCRKERGFHV